MSGSDTRGTEMLAVIGLKLRDLRRSRDLSQREVADAIGLPQSNLSRIENGKQRLNLTVLARMLSIYQTSIQDFFSREGEGARTGPALTAREQLLLESYRRLPPEERAEVDGYVDFRLFRARRERPVGAGAQP